MTKQKSQSFSKLLTPLSKLIETIKKSFLKYPKRKKSGETLYLKGFNNINRGKLKPFMFSRFSNFLYFKFENVKTLEIPHNLFNQKDNHQWQSSMTFTPVSFLMNPSVDTKTPVVYSVTFLKLIDLAKSY